MSNWSRVAVSDLCELIVDCVNKTAPTVEVPTPYKMIRTTNIKNGRVDLSDCRSASKETFEKWTKRAAVLRDDVLLTREAPMGDAGKVNFDCKVFLGQRVVQYRVNSKKLTSDFLLYSFLSPDLQYQFRKHDGGGSTVSHIRVPDCLKFEIPLPSLAEQKKISAVLAALDAKIDLNNRINGELEALAKTIYDYWFVQFDYPDAEGRPYKTSGGKMVWSDILKREIPAEWDAGCLGDALQLEYGKPLKDSDRSGSGYPVMGSNGVVGFHNVYLVEGPGIVVGRKGTAGAVTYSHEHFFPIDTTYYVKAKLGYGYPFLRELLTSLPLARLNGDSAVPGLNRESAHRIVVVLPARNIAEKYESMVAPFVQKIRWGLIENRELTQLRDWLLPLLMNGQVKPAGL